MFYLPVSLGTGGQGSPRRVDYFLGLHLLDIGHSKNMWSAKLCLLDCFLGHALWLLNKVIIEGLALNWLFQSIALSFITLLYKSWFHDLVLGFDLNAHNHVNNSSDVFVEYLSDFNIYVCFWNCRVHLLIGVSGGNQLEHLMACAHSMRQLYVSLKRYVIIMAFTLKLLCLIML